MYRSAVKLNNDNMSLLYKCEVATSWDTVAGAVGVVI